MNKKRLAIELSKLEKVDSNKTELEQYYTDSELASEILWDAFMNGDIESKVIADLGCGNGVFGIGTLMLGAEKVYFLDVDSLEVAKKNCSFDNAEFLNEDVKEFNKKVDVVVMNPPFGVQNEHADREFLEVAMKYSDKIYTIHKIESDKFIRAFSEDNGFEVEGVKKLDFILKKTMDFHKKSKYAVNVGLWILKRKL